MARLGMHINLRGIGDSARQSQHSPVLLFLCR